MKRISIRISSVILTILMIFSVQSGATGILAGDINKNGKIDAADARLALRYSVNLEEFDDEMKLIGNVDGNDKITAADARIILRMSVGLEELFYLQTEEKDSFFEVHFIDVGQADCILVICDGETLLIDGGNTGDAKLISTYITGEGISELDYVLSTHAHEDHVGGLGEILNEFTVTEAVFAPETGADTECYKDFIDAVKAQELEIITPETNFEITLGDSTVKFINPATDKYIGKNNTSIVTKITYGNTSFLFTGDAEREAEQIILETGIDISADVLKVGHHGGATSTTYPFLREIMPKIAVISVGEGNSYGHPTEEVLSKLRDADAKVYRTDMQGHIKITSDGENLTVTTNKNQDIETNPTVPSPENTAYIGNRNSKIFHKDTCSSLPKEENRIYFESRAQAVENSFTPCSRCKP